MKNAVAIGWILLGLMGGPFLGMAWGEDPEPTRISVLTYNIHHAEGTDGVLDLPRIADVIRRAKPDVVALQEVDQGAMRTGGVMQADELGRLLPMNVVFGGNIDLEGGKYGNAVLSRFEIARHANHALPKFDKSEQRGVLEVELRIPGCSETLHIWGTHFDHRPDTRERDASSVKVNELAEPTLASPAILLGDFNARPGSQAIRTIEEKWTRAVPPESPRAIDHIFFRPMERWRLIEVRVLREPAASDHLPVLAVFELIGGSQKPESAK